MLDKDTIARFRVPAGKAVRLKDHEPAWVPAGDPGDPDAGTLKEKARQALEENLRELTAAQELLYADDRYAVLVVLQGMDAAGKDATVKHVLSGVNPQGCQVFSFKKPSAEELDHDFLWRYARCLPERGRIGIFNRSYYEEVLVPKVRPEVLAAQRLPQQKFGKKFWEERYEDINGFERHLVRSGTVVLKFFLHLSKGEQRKRFLERLDRPEKHWKFSPDDTAERAVWDDYMTAYEDALSATSTEWAAWHVVPADHKWVTRAVVADVVTSTIRGLDLRYPEVTEEQRKRFAEVRARLAAE